MKMDGGKEECGAQTGEDGRGKEEWEHKLWKMDEERKNEEQKRGWSYTLEAILVAIDIQLMPSVINSDFEVKNQSLSQSLVSARSAEVKLPTLSIHIFSGVTEEWIAFSDRFEAVVSNNKNLTGAQQLQYLKDSLKSDALKIVNSLSITNDNFEVAWKYC
ncbi:DUF1758 domain-containing protein [Trichonephila inaurata madagascariensis]|uniref:DUF1758 domain-containing protein n=1 Tax=Trichonephila inaurata madagascariensis TaxID=2747483 RepID=A0A8X6XAN5_9ARAC|nr:DUF1758 domain-containing protein [Trichonephila inaurata madagascariensis]